MKFTNIRNLKYSKADKSMVDLFATCEEYGEIPMTLNLVDTEDNHTFIDGDKEVPLEDYCKQQFIQQFVEHIPSKIELVIRSKELRLELINRGSKRVEFFSNQHFINSYEKLYKSVL